MIAAAATVKDNYGPNHVTQALKTLPLCASA